MSLRIATTLLLAAPVLAQNDFNYDKLTSGRIGSSLDLGVTNAPANGIALYIVSSNAGPTPLILLDGVDTRSLQVGTDLLGVLSFGITSPTGTAGYSLAVPNNPAVSGTVLHWQVAMLPFSGPTFLGQISNDIVTQIGLQDTGILAPAAQLAARAFAASWMDRNNNAGAGDVVVAGGGTGTLTAATGLASSEVWDFRHMQVTAGPTMGVARALHLAIELTNGKTLLIGGADASGAVINACELYDPATNSFAPAASMATPRILHAACRLADGRVMVAGGTSTLQPDVVTALANTLATVEIYDPTTNTWTSGPAIGGARLGPALTLLPNNQVMVSGGVQVGVLFGVPISAASTTAVQRWNPATNTWSNGPNMSQARAGHQYNQVRLNDGRILFTGGINLPSLLGATSAAPINGAELYNPATNSWATANMASARALHSATVLADGRVAVCGGAQGTLLAPTSIADVEVFNPTTNGWSTQPALTAPRAGHAAALLPDHTLILFGGQDATATTATIETLRF